jgi:hypothetical protein
MKIIITQFSQVSSYFRYLTLSIILSTQFPNNLSMRSFLNMLGLDSHPYNKPNKVTIPYAVMFISLESKKKDNLN